jgi:hypothetical protein
MTKILSLLLLASSINAASQSGSTHGPDCGGGWPTNMAQTLLKNAGVLKFEDIDLSKTKTTRLASEKLNRDLWHQVYLVKFVNRSGESIQAIVVHDASMEECSMTGVQVFLVSKRLDSSPR